MRPLATSWPPERRTAPANGAAQVFSKTSRAAEVPGSSAPPASAMSSSESSPEAAPSKIASSALAADVGQLPTGDGAASPLAMKARSRIHQAALDQLDQVRGHLAVGWRPGHSTST